MFLSVLMPVYNVEKYLKNSIESVVSQLPDDCEIILADDGSTDESGLICDKYAEKYPGKISVIHKENEGLLITRRRLFNETSADWVLCVDSDDTLIPEAVAEIIDLLKNDYKDVDILFFDAECRHLNGKTEIIAPKLLPNVIYDENNMIEVYSQKATGFTLNHMWSKIIRRSIIDFETDYSEYKQLKMGEDSLQTYPILDKAKRVVYVNKVFYSYLKNTSGLTYKPNLNLYSMRCILWPKEDYYFKKWDIPETDIKKAMKNRISDMMNYLLSFADSNKKYSLFKAECERIISDGFLTRAVNYVSDGKGLNKIQKCALNIINSRFFVSYMKLRIEAIIQKLKEL